jgi:hypothetical protein
VRLVPISEGVYVVERTMQTTRFLLSDGRTVDVVTDRDDSDVRFELLAVTGVERIEGSTVLNDKQQEDPCPTPSTSTRSPSTRRGATNGGDTSSSRRKAASRSATRG